MRYAELKNRLEGEVDEDLDALWDAHCSRSGSEDVDGFLGELRARGLVSEDRYRALLFAGSLDLGDFDDLLDGELDELADAALSGDESHLRHTFLGELGRGAMGEVHLVRDLELNRKVAYKRIGPRAAQRPMVLGRFFDEARITAQLEHPNIIPVHGLERDPDGTPAYTMKLVRGRTFKDYIEECRAFVDRGELHDEEHELPTRLEHFLKVCDAMAYAHDRGVIHRDLKPGNLMLGPYNEVYVMDWGIARVVGGPDDGIEELIQLDDGDVVVERTELGKAIGTPAYMSPEQALGQNEDLDGRSDQFALGLVLHELVTLRRAERGQVDSGRAGGELAAIVARATALRPEDRYPHVRDLADDVRRFLHNEEVHARPDGPAQKAMRWLSHHRVTALLAILGLVALVAVTAVAGLVAVEVQQRAAHERERRLGALLSAVAAHSRPIDAAFMDYEMLLEGLRAASVQVLDREPPADAPYVLAAHLDDPDSAPADYRDSAHYGMPVSFDWPVLVLAPGVDEDQVRPLLQRLSLLRTHFRPMFLRSGAEGAAGLTADRAAEVLGVEGVPLVWSYVGLEEGIHLSYPGHAGYPPDYDPRERPWYELSADRRGARWGNPYVDVNGLGLILPCTTAIFDDQGRFRGVAGVELTFDYVIDELLVPRDLRGVDESFLLDEQGRIVVRSTDTERERLVAADAALDMPVFHLPEVVEAVRAGRSGYLSTTTGGRARLVVYQRLHALGWTYALTGDAEVMLGPSPGSRGIGPPPGS